MMNRRSSRVLLSAAVLFAACALQAGVVESSSNEPPAGSMYLGPGWLYNDGAFTILFENVSLSGFSANVPLPQNVGDSAISTFTATITGDSIVNGGTPHPASASADITFEMMKISGPNGNTLGTYDTQMTQLDTGLVFSGIIFGKLRVDPVMFSTGQISVSDAGSGHFQIDSFFNIFTDITFDNEVWRPSTSSSHETLQPLPEPTAFVLLGVGLLSIGALRKRLSRSAQIALPVELSSAE